jgi:hypothetical protein
LGPPQTRTSQMITERQATKAWATMVSLSCIRHIIPTDVVSYRPTRPTPGTRMGEPLHCRFRRRPFERHLIRLFFRCSGHHFPPILQCQLDPPPIRPRNRPKRDRRAQSSGSTLGWMANVQSACSTVCLFRCTTSCFGS